MTVSADPRITAPFAVAGAPLPPNEETTVWVPCPRCWGQREVFYETATGLVPLTFSGCLGLGEKPS